MRALLLLVFLCICAKSFGEVYKVKDIEQNCDLYLAPTSILIENYEVDELEKVSSMPALVFQKYKGEINLKGLWAFTNLVYDLDVDKRDINELLSYNYHSVCLSEDKEIIQLEQSRRLFNDLNNLDKVD